VPQKPLTGSNDVTAARRHRCAKVGLERFKMLRNASNGDFGEAALRHSCSWSRGPRAVRALPGRPAGPTLQSTQTAHCGPWSKVQRRAAIRPLRQNVTVAALVAEDSERKSVSAPHVSKKPRISVSCVVELKLL